MSNEVRAERREYLKRALLESEKHRQEVIAQRERNVHSVDAHALADAGRGAKALLREFLGLGGNLSEVYPGRTRKR
jgi:hypothetical protein